ncbi:MAG: isochorismatase [Caldithrix sp.]|nr:MAG: isochorismatase [Caldithrix sp.]
MENKDLPIPKFFRPDRVSAVWRVPYQERSVDAEEWAKRHNIQPAATDIFRVCLLPVDVQNTFCIPGFELYVGGRSGTGAVDDSRRLCEFIYRNLDVITEICPTLDTHQAMQIFHNIFLVNEKGEHPAPFTLISEEDIQQGTWKFNSAVGRALGIDKNYGQEYLLHYAKQLQAGDKYALTIWPYHAMLGGIGHALVSSVEEAIFFHSVARLSQPDVQEKGSNPLTENYSVLNPEVLEDGKGKTIAKKNNTFLKKLMEFDAVIIAGQAKSHCVAWTIDDLLKEIRATDAKLTEKIFLLEDCTSPVVIPGVIDYTDDADAAFKRFADAGMRVVQSGEPTAEWHGFG